MAKIPLFVMFGESNAASYIENSNLSSSELGTRSKVKIVNNITLAVETLNIPTNNKLGESNALSSASSGWEFAIANELDAGNLTAYPDGIVLVKAGQGGAFLGQFEENATGTDGTAATNYWNKFVARFTAAKSYIQNLGKTADVYILYSQGVNNYISYTGNYAPIVSPADWKTSTEALIARIRQTVGYHCPVIMTKFGSPYDVYTAGIANIVGTSGSDVYSIESQTLARYDAYHWSYSSVKTIASLFIAKINAIIAASVTYYSADYYISDLGGITPANLELGYTTSEGIAEWVAPTSLVPTSKVYQSKTYSVFKATVKVVNSIDPTNFKFRNKNNTSIQSNVVTTILASV